MLLIFLGGNLIFVQVNSAGILCFSIELKRQKVCVEIRSRTADGADAVAVAMNVPPFGYAISGRENHPVGREGSTQASRGDLALWSGRRVASARITRFRGGTIIAGRLFNMLGVRFFLSGFICCQSCLRKGIPDEKRRTYIEHKKKQTGEKQQREQTGSKDFFVAHK